MEMAALFGEANGSDKSLVGCTSFKPLSLCKRRKIGWFFFSFTVCIHAFRNRGKKPKPVRCDFVIVCSLLAEASRRLATRLRCSSLTHCCIPLWYTYRLKMDMAHSQRVTDIYFLRCLRAKTAFVIGLIWIKKQLSTF